MGVMEIQPVAASNRTWGPPSLPATFLKKDYHKSNLKHLKKLSLRNRENAAVQAAAQAQEGPVKASHIIQANKKRYDHVQSRVSAWKSGPGKVDFLKGHQKTGPFLPLSTASNSSEDLTEIKRVSNLRYSKSMRNIGGSEDPAQNLSDYGTMSQSFASMVPPLNLKDQAEVADVEDNDFDDDVSIPFGGTAGKIVTRADSRFSDISIADRKDRILNMIAEIYSTAPISNGSYQPGAGRGLNDCLKKYASVDQVSDVGSVFNGVNPLTNVTRPKCCGRLDSGLSK